MRPPRSLLLVAALAAAGSACGHGGPVDIATLASNSAQVVWEAGQKAAEKKQWEAARQHFRRIVDGFPQSELVPQARLALGDSLYKEGGTANWILAVGAYREFLTFYPSHPRAEYAQLMVAESYYRQRNSADRDQTATKHALEEFDRLVDLYPQSSHMEQARGRIVELRQTLGRAELMAGFFYQKTRKAYRAAIQRYEYLLKEFPDYSAVDEVLLRLAQCLFFESRGAEALPHLARLAEEFPSSPFLTQARALEDAIRKAPAPPPAAATPSPSTPSPSPTPQASLED